VVDDEPAIRDAAISLLTGWGYDVIAVGSGDEAIQRLAACPAKPALILCNYRLRGGESGLAVADRIRAEYNDTIPAILVTGDTAPDRLAEAEASGPLLMHKPVSNGKLQAAIGNLTSSAMADKRIEADLPLSNEARLPGEVRSLGAIDHVHRLEDRGDVSLHRLLRKAEFDGDREIRPPRGQEAQDLDLTIGESGGAPSRLDPRRRRSRRTSPRISAGT
jgi:CheY-like chemotaxis protein